MVSILVTLLSVVALGAILAPKEARLPALSSHSTEVDGGRALYDWMAKLGYQVSNQSDEEFVIPEGTKAVFLLEPDPSFQLQYKEWQVLNRFIQNGGILVTAGDFSGSVAVARHYGFSVEKDGYDHYIVVFSPVLRSPPLDFSKINIRTFFYLERSNFNYLPVLVAENHPYAVELPKGKGKVILVADSILFNNAGLKKPGAAELLLNILSPIPRGSKVWFDEWHHGERTVATTRSGLGDWLLHTPPGRAVLWVLLVVFTGLALMGRYFGRPLTAEKDSIRRAPLEFVNALARLNHRAGHRGEVLHSYYLHLKRSLSQRYRIDPDLSDQEIVRLLSGSHPEIDPSELSNLLKRLTKSNPSEQELVELAHQAAKWIQQIEYSSASSPEGKYK
ncbi:MAG: DUF4350 domain-containing protein [Anaerolineaceae bacterium]